MYIATYLTDKAYGLVELTFDGKFNTSLEYTALLPTDKY